MYQSTNLWRSPACCIEYDNDLDCYVMDCGCSMQVDIARLFKTAGYILEASFHTSKLTYTFRSCPDKVTAGFYQPLNFCSTVDFHHGLTIACDNSVPFIVLVMVL